MDGQDEKRDMSEDLAHARAKQLFKAGWLGEWPGDNGFFHRRYERDDMSEVNVTTKSFVPDVHRGMAAAAVHESGL